MGQLFDKELHCLYCTLLYNYLIMRNKAIRLRNACYTRSGFGLESKKFKAVQHFGRLSVRDEREQWWLPSAAHMQNVFPITDISP